MRKLILTVIILISAITMSAQTSIKVETHNVVAADEQFNVTFIIEGEDSPSGFTWTPPEDFQVLWGPQSGRSTSIQIINGKRTKSVQSTYTYVLKPIKAGTFTLSAASAKIKGKEIVSSPVSIEVLSSGSTRQSSQASQPSSSQSITRSQNAGISDDDIFLALSLNRTNVVVGEPITATLKLYQRVNVAGFESANFPSFNGFWSQELEAPTNIEFSRETYDGQIYNSALLRKFILIPQQQGTVTIDPAELVCLVNVKVSSGGASIFDGFFDDYRTVRKKVTSKAVKVNVKPLPEGSPDSFAGGVGSFSISAKLTKDSLRTHEAASLLITVSGKGNVSLLQEPKVVFPPDMEVYDTKISDKIDNGGLSGSKFYEFPFIPRSHGDFIIEPIKYSYYDVNTKKYVTLSTEPIAVKVAKGDEAEETGIVVSGVNRKDVKNLGEDIRFISTRTPAFVTKGYFLLGTPAFWVVTLLIILTAVISWFMFRGIAIRRADVVGSKNRKATKMALKRLQLAGTFLKQNLYTAFYEELHKALLGFVSDKLNVPMAELSKERVHDLFVEGGVREEQVKSFIDILDACEFARYSPDSGNEAMAAHYNAAVDVISSIDSAMKGKKSVTKPSAALILIMCLLPAAANAQDDSYVDSLWNAANAAYVDGRWSDAIDDYSIIVGANLESASLYCNLAGAYYKNGDIAKAILNYERSLKVDPSYSDARYNLSLLNERIQDRIEPVPELIIKVWVKKLCYLLDSDAWVICFFVFLALTLSMVLLFLLSPTVGGRRTGFFLGIFLLVLAGFSIGSAMVQKNDYMNTDDAIVMRPVISVKSSPSSGSSQDLFILHEGTKIRIIDEVGEWNNIELADGRQGWLKSDEIETI